MHILQIRWKCIQIVQIGQIMMLPDLPGTRVVQISSGGRRVMFAAAAAALCCW